MGLRSKLLSGDPKLEACLVADPAHVTPGSRGDHVAKIQTALNALCSALLKVDGIYGQATADAVTAYKNDPSRRILQPWQTTADDIVGKRTIASLDREMLLKETKPASPFRIYALYPPARPSMPVPAVHRSAVTLAFKIPAAFRIPTGFAAAGGGIAIPPLPVQSLRLRPRDSGGLRVVGIGSSAFLQSTNLPAPKGDCNEKITWLWDPALVLTGRLCPEPFGLAAAKLDVGGRAFGNNLLLTDDPKDVVVDAFNPGDANISGANSAGQTYSFHIEVRAPSAGPVPRPPLTKLEPGSKFFSASAKNGGEFDPHGVCAGRPVNPRRGGRLINLGGEQETPEFEDYQVNLGFSGYLRSFTGNKFVFRPFVDDTDPTVRVADKSASHICVRGSPLTDEFIAAIKRMARGSCLFTFDGGSNFAQKAKQTLAGTVLEENLPEGRIVIEFF